MIALLLFCALLLIGCKPCKAGTWNESFLSQKQMRAVRGWCALGIILHHISQKSAAPWLPAQFIVHGLDPFVNIGCFFVGVFLFASGYGLYKSARKKANYFDGYFRRRFLPVFLAYASTSLVYYLVKGIPSTYTWYIGAIVYLYLMFLLCFRKGKNDGRALLLLCASIILYCAICDFAVFGTWWYNTVGLFPLGIAFAMKEEHITAFLRRRWLPCLIAFAAVMTSAYFASLRLNDFYYTLNGELAWLGCRAAMTALQFAASCCFTGLVLLLGMKARLGNPVMHFLGGITLELYLIHGLFVQLFGYCYFNADVAPLYYIRNVPLYTAVVLACSIASAVLLSVLHKAVLRFLDYIAESGAPVLAVAKKDLRRVLCGLGIALAAVLIICFAISAVKRPSLHAAAEDYRKAHITAASVNGRSMAAYLTGDGEDTLVLFRGSADPCPTLTLRTLADELASDYRVVVLDQLGTGFSDPAENARTAQNIASEMHTALENLGISKSYMLMPWEDAAPWAMLYVQQYKEEVKAVIPVDAEVWQAKQAELEHNGVYVPDWHRLCTRDGFIRCALKRFTDITGLDLMLWPVWQPIYERAFTPNEQDAVQHILFRRAFTIASAGMLRHHPDDLMCASGMKYPREVFVLDIFSSGREEAYKEIHIPLSAVLETQCTAKKKHCSVPVINAPDCAYTTPKVLHEILLENLP